MTIVKMTQQITGYRNGAEWPCTGDEIDLPDHEAADLVLAGYAVTVDPAGYPAGEPAPRRTADAPAPVKRGRK